MKKTLLAIGAMVALVIACQVNTPDTTPDINDVASATDEEAPKLDPIFTVVEEPATFPGGKEAWNAFIAANLTIPEANPQGRVFASFVTDTEGAIHDIQLIRGIGYGADEAVVELLKKSPNWEAAKQRGREVNARMQVVIQFGEPSQIAPATSSTHTAYDMNAGFDEVYMVVEEQASFPGGKEAWEKYLEDHLQKPATEVKGKVFATFIVDKSGGIHNVQLIRGIGGGADEAVKELLENSPNWLAAKQRDKNVNSRMQVVISFR